MKDRLTFLLEKHGFEDRLLDEMTMTGRLKKYQTGDHVIHAQQSDKEMPVVLNGLLKVMSIDRDGSELFLYYLQPGEMCPMSLACCLRGEGAAFNVTAEEPSEVWLVPTKSLDGWMARYPSFRRYVMSSYQLRFQELMTTIDSLVFHDLRERLMKYLLDTKQATGSYVINKTHQEIAAELNSSRVVISRLLKQLETEQVVEQHRNRIEIL